MKDRLEDIKRIRKGGNERLMGFDFYEEDNKELKIYTFYDFCIDRKILPKSAALEDFKVMWGIYSKEYIKYCAENELDYEEEI